MFMKKFVLSLSLFLLIGCDSGSTNKSSTISDACYEMNATSVGFSGPSKRIDIMKSYGFSLEEASALNSVVSLTLETSQAWSFDSEKSDCIMNTFSCTSALTAITNGNLDSYAEGWKMRMDRCNLSPY